ncbi:hypothetical protein [Asticcacaulis solisilvae]|uniref:hypothetical protein n=1 Tax=Asticcacaulis solisilvae TaxID=1217274 RepID=UPI003FD732E5
MDMISFGEFEKYFRVDNTSSEAVPDIYPGSSIISQHVNPHYSGKSYGRGIYRFHDFSKCDFWTKIVLSIFPEQRGKLFCFSYDWLGRQFAFDPNDHNTIHMVDIDQGEVLSMESSLENFHDVELVENSDDILAVGAFNDFFGANSSIATYQSVGYKKPLFLGGEDRRENREVIDMEVYWSIGAQLLDKIKPLAAGTRVDSIKLL